MLNYLWAGMIIIGIIYSLFAGTLPDITAAALDSAKEAVTLSITMLGVMGFWMGFMKIASQAGIVRAASVKMYPVMQFLFPNIQKDSKAYEYITANIIANVLGLGAGATAFGLQAMEALAEQGQQKARTYPNNQTKNQSSTAATDEMCTFLVINISSLQLIPINIIAYRSQYGSVDPAAVVGPGIAATIASTLAAVVFCKWMCRKIDK